MNVAPYAAMPAFAALTVPAVARGIGERQKCRLDQPGGGSRDAEETGTPGKWLRRAGSRRSDTFS